MRGVLLGMLGHIVEHGAEILHVEDEQAAFVGNTEHDVEHAVLCLVKTQ